MIKTKTKKLIRKTIGRSIVSKHGFWYIDIPRTSSTSIRAELSRHFFLAYGKQNLLEKSHARFQLFPDHMPAIEMRDMLSHSVWDKIFTFTIVRNPWERIFSMYNYRKKKGSIPSSLSFRDYVFALKDYNNNKNLFKFKEYYYGCSDYILDEKENLIVDFIVRFENRADDLKVIASKINCDDIGNIHTQRATEKSYIQFYDLETKKIIGNIYKKDIDMFKYKFGS